jgi:hypothetical protein
MSLARWQGGLKYLMRNSFSAETSGSGENTWKSKNEKAHMARRELG